jgi:cyclopropane fatty-acyl-phospholipid synthase-like methyltransferase
MPKLDTNLHLKNMVYWRKEPHEKADFFGLHWGDPQKMEPLRHVRDHFLLPYVNPDHVAVEIGPGGGRWTRYMLGFGHLYAFDYHQESLDQLSQEFRAPYLYCIKNNGGDFPGLDDESVDFLFSFGTFVHLDFEIIETYLTNIERILKPGAIAVIQYSDKTKEAAQKNASFSENDPDRMRAAVLRAGYVILEEDLTTMHHSAIVRFTRRNQS